MTAHLDYKPLAGRTCGRYAKALAMAGGDAYGAAAIASAQSWSDARQIELALKAQVDALSTEDMVAAFAPVGLDFAQATRPLTIVGRLPVRRVLPNTRTMVGTGASTGHFVAEGAPTPMSESAFASGVTMRTVKVGGVEVVTRELARSSSPDAADIIGADLAAGNAQAQDVAFLDPNNDGSGAAPASILYEAVSISSSGTTLAAIDSDLRALLQTFDDGLTLGYFIMSRHTATFLSLLRGTGGCKAFPELEQGRLLGLPVLASSAARMAGSPGGGILALVDAAEILLADEGQSSIDTSDVAALQTSDTPSGAAAPMQSLWTNGLTALKALRWLTWQRRRDGAAAYISALAF